MTTLKSQLPTNFKIVTGTPVEFENLITDENGQYIVLNYTDNEESEYPNKETININNTNYFIETAILADSVADNGQGMYIQKL